MARRPKDEPSTILIVVPGGYRFASAFDEEIHARFTLGAQVEASITQNKSNPQLRLYWGFLKWVADGTGRWPSARSLSNSVLVEIGFVESFTALMGGGVHAHPMSIAELDHRDFDELCKRVFAVIEEELGISIDQYKAFQREKARR